MYGTTFLLILAVFIGAAYGQGGRPEGCRDPIEIDQHERSVTHLFVPGDDPPLCDRNLRPDRWYKFTSGAGGEIPVGCPANIEVGDGGQTCAQAISCCGTLAQAYLEGVPPEINSMSTMTASIHSGGDCHAGGVSWEVEVANCGNYKVYKSQTQNIGCPWAFCAGNLTKCPPGFNSETGFSPCHDDFPDVTITPSIRYDVNDGQYELLFVCEWGTVPDATVGVQVQFFGDGKPVSGVRQHASNNGGSDILHENDAFDENSWQMGQNITCKTRAYFLANPTVPGYWSQSNIVETGIETPHTEDLVFTINDFTMEERYQLRFRPKVPVLCQENVVDFCNYYQLHLYFGPKHDTDSVPRDDCVNNGEISFTPSIRTSACLLPISAEDWDQDHEMEVRAQFDDISDSPDGISYSRFKIHSYTGHSVGINEKWHHYTLPLITAHVYRESSSVRTDSCRVYNDPRFNIFGKKTFNYHHEGEFILVRDADRDIQINGYFTPCTVDSGGTCLCGIAIRHRSMVLKISRCEGLEGGDDLAPMVLRLYHNHCPDRPPGFRVVKSAHTYDSLYTVHLPTGAEITLETRYYRERFIQFYYYPSRGDIGNLEGICGRYGESGNNAMRDRNGNVQSNANTFAAEWRAQTHEKIMHGQPGDQPCWELDENDLCLCNEDDAGDDTEHLVCEPVSQFSLCIPVGRVDIMGALFNESRDTEQRGLQDNPLTTFAGISYTQGREKRSRRAMKSSSIPSGVSNEEYCSQLIGDNPVSHTGVLDDVYVESTIEACIGDLNLTGDPMWAESALGTISVATDKAVSKNISMWDISGNVTGGNVTIQRPSDIDKLLCPVNCSGNGVCSDEGKCVCNAGFEGSDCSIDETAPPEILAIGANGRCDRNARPCHIAQMFGGNFGDIPTCHYQEIQSMKRRKSFTLPGDVWTPMELRCPIPEPKDVSEAYSISVSNKGDPSDAFTFITYDSVCQDCDVDRSPLCVQRTDACTINHKCYTNGAVNPEDMCLLCDPQRDINNWSTSSAATCIATTPVPTSGPGGPSSNTPVWVILVAALATGCVVAAALAGVVVAKKRAKRTPPPEEVYKDDHVNPAYAMETMDHMG